MALIEILNELNIFTPLNATSAPGLNALIFATATFSLKIKTNPKIYKCISCNHFSVQGKGFEPYIWLTCLVSGQMCRVWVLAFSMLASAVVECYQFWLDDA